MSRPEVAMNASPRFMRGTSASPGFARGPLHVLADDIALGSRPGQGPQSEAAALREALTQATRELNELTAHTVDPDARTLLEFQVAMLEDDSLAQPAFAAIAMGATAEAGWQHALDAQIAEYRDAADAYFAARASDLRDMRDRVLRRLGGAALAAIPAGAIVVAADLAPSRFLETAWDGGGIALFAGSPQSHLATLARARGVPMIVAMSPAGSLPPGDVLLDAHRGVLIAAPDSESVRAFDARRTAARVADAAAARLAALPAATADGDRVQVLLNVARLDDLAGLAPGHCDGIGLVRTELVLREPADLHDEDRQFEHYRAIVAWAQDRPVTFRTLDAGGDKPIAGYTLAGEPNPFLGVRGVRLSLLHPAVLSTQLRALARAAAVGNVKVMVPMITQPAELERVRGSLAAAIAEVEARGTPCGRPPLGMMVEVPAAALTIDGFAADFFSIGSNDLIAYTTATSRDSDQLAELGDPLQPAVMRLIAAIVRAARAAGREVSLCGDMAGDPRCVPALLAAGLRRLSIAPVMLGRVKAAIAAFSAPGVDGGP
jgi:phosphotransferase system enzyme I (PtsI)